MNKLIFAAGTPGLGELLVILLIVLVLFGASRIPQIARALGQGIREFKKASKEGSEQPPDDRKP